MIGYVLAAAHSQQISGALGVVVTTRHALLDTGERARDNDQDRGKASAWQRQNVRRKEMHCPWPRASVANTRACRAGERPTMFDDEPTHPIGKLSRGDIVHAGWVCGRANGNERAWRTQPKPFVRESTHDLLGR